ncbi:unnamed protein product [Larinioides sclopetarius]|uniref:Multiple coagulation factor deficiency protein 2 n=1 Tax=Larinioides sclopetarius TaxID=280406 RepID=A0AAV1ZJT8_9ARAC
MGYDIAFKILVVLFVVDSYKPFPFEQHFFNSNSPLDEVNHIHHHINAISVQDIHQRTRNELDFLYFRMYDSDRNDKLDGCEIIQSLFHWHEKEQYEKNANISIEAIRIFESEELASLVDPILESDDKNMDGFIDFSEYISAEARRLK